MTAKRPDDVTAGVAGYVIREAVAVDGEAGRTGVELLQAHAANTAITTIERFITGCNAALSRAVTSSG